MNKRDDEAVQACKSVMVEVMTILGKHRDHLVIIGGWVPGLLFGEGDHVGSIDVDLAVNWRSMPEYVYETIKNELAGREYYRDGADPANRFRRKIQINGREIVVKVDIITGLEPGQKKPSHRVVHGLPLWCASGVRVALEHFVETKIQGMLPNGAGHNTVTVRVASAGALLVMKGMALGERYKEKDAYDIYYCCRHHPEGIEGLARELSGMLDDSEVKIALTCIKEKFERLDSIGPVWVAQMMRESGDDYEQVQQDAFRRVNALLGLLKT